MEKSEFLRIPLHEFYCPLCNTCSKYNRKTLLDYTETSPFSHECNNRKISLWYNQKNHKIYFDIINNSSTSKMYELGTLDKDFHKQKHSYHVLFENNRDLVITYGNLEFRFKFKKADETLRRVRRVNYWDL